MVYHFRCEVVCPNNESCTQGCRCQNNGKCYGFMGQCECTAGWTGEVCANKYVLVPNLPNSLLDYSLMVKTIDITVFYDFSLFLFLAF